MLLPGFIDAHVHAQAGALGEFSCNILEAKSLEQGLQMIKYFYENNKETEKWINGMGWRGEWFKDGIALASVLDEILPDFPICLRKSDGHGMWANTKAMEIAGISSPQVLSKYEGLIYLDDQGKPIGCFAEGSAHLFDNFRGQLPLETRIKAVNRVSQLFAECGITGYHEALARGVATEAYLKSEKILKVSLALWWDPEKGLENLESIKSIATRSEPKMTIRTVKLMYDGVVETQTALMQQPYCKCHIDNSKSTSGVNHFKTEDNFRQTVKLIDKEGFQIHIHAIGDKAITDSLSAIEEAIRENGPRERRHMIAHLHVFNPSDIERLKQSDIIANLQPIWSVADSDMVNVITPLLGDTRSSWQYPIKTILEKNIKYCFGSDWYVSPFNPLLGIQVAVTHALHPDQSVWMPQQIIKLQQALYGYTAGAAYATFSEDKTGSLQVGKAADLILLNKNLFRIPPNTIQHVQVLTTLVDGKIIYQRK
eukprot:TRINITY_DN12269_c0_g1_i2.p1 TRINITY_DN12269_c0_g1~~TRINITY_DN12269_c0_g1_i2.p1  ORF type:complete len:547 (-),score=83.56 TRINITY_DN12269_c0_g1_i2:51-1496(-)